MTINTYPGNPAFHNPGSEPPVPLRQRTAFAARGPHVRRAGSRPDHNRRRARAQEGVSSSARTDCLGIGILVLVVVWAAIITEITGDTRPNPQTTSSARPTGTPRPTAKPTLADPCTAPDAMRYRSDLGDRLATMKQALTELEKLFARAGNNPMLIYDEDWLVDVAAVLVVMKLFGDNVSELTAPHVLRSAHSHLLAAADYYDRTADTVARGIDDADVELLLEGYALLEDGAASLELANAAFERACE